MLFKGRVPHSHVHYHGDRTVEGLLAFLVAAQQDEELQTDPKALPDGHAAVERIARDLQLLEAPVVAAEAPAATAAGGAEAGGVPVAEAGGAAAAAAADGKAVAAGASEHEHGEHALDPAHPGRALALIEAIHKAGLHAPGDAARAVLEKLLPAGRSAEGKDKDGGADGSGSAGGRRLEAAAAAGSGTGAPVGFKSGCRLAGFVDVRRVPGAIRIVPALGGMSANPAALNMSHAVHELFFGPRLSNYQLSRLPKGTEDSLHRMRGAVHVADTWNTSVEHHVRVVGRTFAFATGHAVETFAYTVDSHAFEAEGSGSYLADAAASTAAAAKLAEAVANATADVGSEIAAHRARFDAAGKPPPSLPLAVRWSYDLSPLAVTLTEVRQPLYRWLVSICAIVGGAFTVLGLLDSALHSVKGSVAFKKTAGKLS